MKKEITLNVNKDWCKGCQICVELCPHNVLDMVDGKAHVENLPACTGCLTCELHCPDFAITVQVEKHEEK